MATSNDSQIREHCTRCPVPGLCPGSSHGWMSFWGFHLLLPWGAAPVSSWEWLDSPDTGRTPFYLPFYVRHPLPTPVPVNMIPVCCTPDPRTLPVSEGKMGLNTDTEKRAELGR